MYVHMRRFLYTLFLLLCSSHKFIVNSQNAVYTQLNIRAKDLGPEFFTRWVDLKDGKLVYYHSLGEHRINEIIDGDEIILYSEDEISTRYVQYLDSTLAEFIYFETGGYPSNDYRCFLKFKSDVQWRGCARTLFVLFLQRTCHLVSVDLDKDNSADVIDITDAADADADDGDDNNDNNKGGNIQRTIVPRDATLIQLVTQGTFEFWRFDPQYCDLCLDIKVSGNAQKPQLELSIKSGTTAQVKTFTYEKINGAWAPKRMPLLENASLLIPGYATVADGNYGLEEHAAASSHPISVPVDEEHSGPSSYSIAFTSLADVKLLTLNVSNLTPLEKYCDMLVEFILGPNTSVIDVRTKPGYAFNKLIDAGHEIWQSSGTNSERIIIVTSGDDVAVTLVLYEPAGNATAYFRRTKLDGWRQIGKREHRIVGNRMARFIEVDVADFYKVAFSKVQGDDGEKEEEEYTKHQFVPGEHCIISLVKHHNDVIWKYREDVLDVIGTLVIFGTRSRAFLLEARVDFYGNKHYRVFRRDVSFDDDNYDDNDNRAGAGASKGVKWIETDNASEYWPILVARSNPMLTLLPRRINDLGPKNLINFTAAAVPAHAKRDNPIDLHLENLEGVTGTKLLSSIYEGGARGTYVLAYASYGIKKVYEDEKLIWESEPQYKGASYIYLVEGGNCKLLQVTRTHWGSKEVSRYAQKTSNGWEWIRRQDFVSYLRLWKKRVEIDVYNPCTSYLYTSVDKGVAHSDNSDSDSEDDDDDFDYPTNGGNYKITIIPTEDVFVERILDCGQVIWEYKDHLAQVIQGVILMGSFTLLSMEIALLDNVGNYEYLNGAKVGADWTLSYPLVVDNDNDNAADFVSNPAFEALIAALGGNH